MYNIIFYLFYNIIYMNRIIKNTSSTDHVYYNIVMSNNTVTDSQIATYNAPRTTALLENPSDYYVSIIRFTVPLQNVPIFVFKDNSYSVTISYNGVDHQTFLVYVPDYAPIAIPSSPFNKYVFYYQQFLDSINNGLTTSFTNFNTSLPVWSNATTYSYGDIVRVGLLSYFSLQSGNLNKVPSAEPTYWELFSAPYLTIDYTTQLISVNASIAFFNTKDTLTTETQPLKIWFNTYLFQFFANFNILYNKTTPEVYNTNGKNVQIIIKDNYNNRIVLQNGLNGYVNKQEYNSLYNWNDLRNIVFLTSTIPIRNEGIPAQASGVSDTVSNATTSSASLPILTDFQIKANLGGDERSYAQYNPDGEYRLVDLTGTTPLTNIDLTVYWQDRFLNLYPLYLPPKNTLDVKLLFRKKSVKGNLTYLG
jgi:hypothetical protein